MLVLLRPRVSSRVSGFPVALPCLWGKLQNLSFSKVSRQIVISFCVAGVALQTCFFVTCGKSFGVEGAILLRCFHKMSCSFRGSRSILKVSTQVVLSFCVAGAALCDIPTCLMTCRRSVYVAGAVLWRRFQKFSCQAQHFGDLCHNFVWQAQRSTLRTLHFTLHPVHFTLHTLHSTLYTLYSTL